MQIKPIRHKKTGMIWLLGLFIILNTHAAEPEEEASLTDRTIEAGKDIGKFIDKTAEAIDIILAGKKYTKKANPSSINISQVVGWSEGGNISNNTNFGLNLRLPNLEKRWQLR